jgi:hypothetical protein
MKIETKFNLGDTAYPIRKFQTEKEALVECEKRNNEHN